MDSRSFDLITGVFTFDYVPASPKSRSCGISRGLLRQSGTLANLVSSSAICMHEWASFATAEFPENREAVSGDVVRIVTKDGADQRPVEDILCTDASYRELYDRAGLHVTAAYQPLATAAEPTNG